MTRTILIRAPVAQWTKQTPAQYKEGTRAGISRKANHRLTKWTLCKIRCGVASKRFSCSILLEAKIRRLISSSRTSSLIRLRRANPRHSRGHRRTRTRNCEIATSAKLCPYFKAGILTRSRLPRRTKVELKTRRHSMILFQSATPAICSIKSTARFSSMSATLMGRSPQKIDKAQARSSTQQPSI